jgi:biotin carboxyl carrier protein
VQYEAEVNGRGRRVAVRRQDGRLVVDIDGRPWSIDAVAVGDRRWSLLLDEGSGRQRSREVTLTVDSSTGRYQVHVGPAVVPVLLNGRRRSGRKDEGGIEGPQRIVAPMPGKVVRLLVKAGDPVRTRQPVAVVEAMKMENELRSGRDGVVVDVRVAAGQSVDAGALIAVIASPATDA